MSISKSTQYGNIEISIDAIASLAGGVVTECYGVVGMASQKFLKDGIAELLKKENYAKRCCGSTEGRSSGAGPVHRSVSWSKNQ